MPENDHLNHKPDAEGIQQIEALRRYIIGLDDAIHTLVPFSRERALALTKLEEVRMWAVKAIVMQYPAEPLNPFAVTEELPADTDPGPVPPGHTTEEATPEGKPEAGDAEDAEAAQQNADALPPSEALDGTEE